MFTGIVQGKAKIIDIENFEDLKRFKVEFPTDALKGLQQGASISLNGVCLTVTEYSITSSIAKFDVMIETLSVTNLNMLNISDSVNYERAATFGKEIGGHVMSGHISDTVTLLKRIETETNCELVFSISDKLQKYVLPKGFVGLNGCSLTIGSGVTDQFSVYLIPETLNMTTFGTMSEGDIVNLEIDPQTQAIVDTVKRYLKRDQ